MVVSHNKRVRPGTGVSTCYLDGDGSGWAIVLATLLFPPLGIYWINKHRRQWLSGWKIPLVLVVWLLTWLLLLSQLYRPAVFEPSYDGSAVYIKRNHDQSDGQIDAAAGQSNNADTTPNGGQSDQSQQAQATNNGNPMDGIAVAPAESVAYNRDDYQPDWDVGSGCDIRSRVLASSSTVSVQYGSNGCTVTYGSWVDPYTGQTLTGNPYRGDGTANDLDIDHIIPLKYVNEHGGAHWTAEQKRSYGASLEAMNNGVYVAVSASENREKSDSGPSEYYPPNQNYRCEYAKKWRDIARLYHISLAQSDYDVVSNTLVSCGIN